MKKRMYALILCLAMVFTFAPTLAYAEDTVIDTVQITIADPVAGEYPTYMSDMLEGKNYTVSSEHWINNTDGFVDLRAKETFELGKEYIYSVWLSPAEGYSFARDAVATINNPNWTIVDMWVTDEGSMHFQANFTVTTGENKVVPDEEKIKETLNLNLGTYNSQPGQTPTHIGDAIDCERYYVSYETWYNITDNKQLTEEDTFETGKLYTYTIYIKPYEEYAFAEDSQVIIDGIEWNRNWMLVSNGEDSKGEFCFWAYYTPGLEPIDNVTVNIENVEEGKQLVFVEDVPQDANYTIYEQQWRKETEELPQDSIYSGIGSYYYYHIIFAANDGYRFTSNTTVTVNGIEWEYIDSGALDAELPGDCLQAGLFGGFTLWEKETEATTEVTTTEITTEEIAEVTTEAEVATEAATAEETTSAPINTPETGNVTNVVLWISLLCIAAAGTFVTVIAVRAKKQ